MEKMEEQLSQADIQQQALNQSLTSMLDTQLGNSEVKTLGDKYLSLCEANIQAGLDRQEQLDNFQFRINGLKDLATYAEHDGYGQFIEILKRQEMSALDVLFYTMSHSRESSSYLKMNGFPTNKTSIDLFNAKFDTNLSASIETNKKATNADEANAERLVELYDKLDSTELAGTQTLDLLSRLKDGDTSAYSELKTILLENPDELQKLLLAAKNSDAAHPESQVFQEITLILIDIDPSFGDKIRAFEEKHAMKGSLETSYLLSISGRQIERVGNSLISRGEENEVIAVDIGKVPPTREVSLDGESYFIESNFPLADLHKPELEYQKAYMETMPKIRAAGLIKTMAVQEHIKDLAEHRASLDEIKSTLKLCYRIDVSFINSMDDLKPSNLESQMQEFQKTLDNAMQAYKTGLDAAIQSNREKVKEQDRRKREILQFVRSTGFDLIDQHHTDSLIQEVQANTLVVHGLDLAVSRLDIANGMFGESTSEYGGTKWKQNLVQFYNKMISGTPDQPLSVEAHTSLGGKVEDRTEMQYLLKSHGLLNDTGAFNKEKARENLRAVVGDSKAV